MKRRLLILWLMISSSQFLFAQSSIEIIAKRSLNSRTFLNLESGSMSVEISGGYLHYWDKTGQLQKIDHRIIVAPDSAGYQVERGLFRVGFGFDLKKNDYPITFEMSDRTRFQAKLTSLAYFNRASKQIVTLQDVQNSSASAKDNKVLYSEAFDGIDVEFEYLDTALKQYAYLSQKGRDNLPDPQSLGLNPNNTDLVFVTRIDMPDSLDAFVNNVPVSTKSNGRIRLTYEGDGKLEFRNAGGKAKFFLPADFAFVLPSNGADSSGQRASSHKMQRRFFSANDENFMISGVPVRWLWDQPQGVIVLDPSVTLQAGPEGKDTFIYKSGGGNDNHGAMGQLQIGPDRTAYERRGLIQFDLTAIPSNATITSATLQLYLFGNSGDAGTSYTIEAHKMLRSWVEGSGTVWNGGNTSGCDWTYTDKPTNTSWNAPGMQSGNDYEATILGTASINFSDDEVWKNWSITPGTVQGWVANSSSNFGIALISATADISKYIASQFYSSDYVSSPALRPKLIINYSVDPLVEITYDALSRPISIAYANGVTETNQYDVNRGWLTRRDYQKSGSNIYYFNSTLATDFDKAGNLKHVEYQHKNDAVEHMYFAYNRLYRLGTFTPPSGSGNNKNYTYDLNGNLSNFEGLTFLYNKSGFTTNNQLKEVKNGSTSVTTYQYDKAGRAKQVNTTNVAHDFRQSMLSHGTNTYSYDAFGERIKKSEAGAVRYYITSGPEVLAEYTNNSGPAAEYIHAFGRMIAKFDPAKGYSWFYVDHLNNTRLVDGSDDGQTDMRRDYYPYGQTYLAAGTDQANYQFTGKELDSATNLYYFGVRYYDRSIGRWLTPDPIASEFSPYSYVNNRPLNFVDRFGLGDEPAIPADWWKGDFNREWDAIWSPSTGGGPGYSRWVGTSGSYLNHYRNSSGGHWKKQYYGVQTGSGPTVWQGYDWIWVPGKGETPIYNVDQFLADWTRSKLSLSNAIKTNLPILAVVPGSLPFGFYFRHNYYYIYQNSKQGGSWDLKPLLRDIPQYSEALYEFHGELYQYDELGNIGWGAIMATNSVDPIIAMSAAGAYQMFEVFIRGQNKPVNWPFGDDIRDTRAIWRGYQWAMRGR